jgi:3-phosphoshikimate 1-carboxyvinyltransferase
VRVLAGPWARHEVALPAGVSSQFASALLLAAPRAGGLVLRLVGEAVSDAYLRLTTATMARFGVPVAEEGATWRVAPGAPRATRLVVEADASSAAVWWAAAARAGDVDLRATPDLAPLVAALAADAVGETRIVRTPHLRWKESDRIATLVEAVRSVGGDAEERDDGLVVRGRPLTGGRVVVRGDHRIALAFGVLGLAVPGVALEGAEAVEKSYPGFLDRLAECARA